MHISLKNKPLLSHPGGRRGLKTHIVFRTVMLKFADRERRAGLITVAYAALLHCKLTFSPLLLISVVTLGRVAFLRSYPFVLFRSWHS